MPFFSVCITAYNDEPYLEGCIESVLSQSFGDFELIIVDDASSDASVDKLRAYANSDNRIKLVERKENGGPHLARRDAATQASGDYLVFLDADDEFKPNFLSAAFEELDAEPVSMLHFGIDVVAENGVTDEAAATFGNFVNQKLDFLKGGKISDAIFGGAGEYLQDWRITQRIYRTGLIKQAFNAMSSERLDCAEDYYEMFVITTLAATQATDNDIIGLAYHYGRGLNGAEEWEGSKFTAVAKSFWRCAELIDDFAEQRNEENCSRNAIAGVIKLQQLLFNDWLNRVDDAQKIDTALVCVDIVGAGVVSTEVMRCARDAAWSLLTNGGKLADRPCIEEWYNLAASLAAREDDLPLGYQTREAQAKQNIAALKQRDGLVHYENKDIRIFVSTHKNVDLFESNILQPVQVGCSKTAHRFPWALQDDAGENISDLNPMYCELTTQYWAWKNIDAAYIGFCHYRRYFDFSSNEHAENIYGEVMDSHIDGKTQQRYALDDASIRKAIEGYDVITTPLEDVRRYSGNNATMRSHYDAAPHLHVEDLDRVVEILVKRYPDYEEDARAFLAGHTARFCNMFIMRRDIFRAYCEWLFPLLEEFTNSTDMSRYTKEGLRTPGHLSERLLNIYLMHHERTGAGWKTKQLQCVHFEHPEKEWRPSAMIAGNELKPIVPVVFAADNRYVPMVSTTIYSMLKNASPDYRYDICILTRDISANNQARMRSFFSRFNDAAISFYDVSRMIEGYELSTNNKHISIETYYRFLVQELFPFYKKVLYLDSDLIVEGDISELYKLDLKDNLLAAVRDVDFLAHVNNKNGERAKYAHDVLGMSDPYSYFQAGVLLFNVPAMKGLLPTASWLKFAGDPRFIYNDQDALNAQCGGKVVYLDYDWNVMIDCDGRIGRLFSYAPAPIYEAFLDSRKHERIIHYAGFQKPWSMVGCDRADRYWKYARETPFYEDLIAHLSNGSQPAQNNNDHEPAVSEDSPLRRIVDPIAPYGTKRREVIKSIGRAVQGKK